MKIVSVVGARPQFIKAAMVSKALHKSQRAPLEDVLVHTGQHYDPEMSAVFFEELEIPKPAYNLEVGSASHGRQTGEMLMRLEDILLRESPDIVLVYGDTNTTLAGALAATKLQISIAHIEAGLRSGDKSMPEEINRILVDHMSDFLFCPTKTAIDNLRREGIIKGVDLVGDVMLDAALYYAGLARKKSQILSIWNLQSKNYLLATIHRAANTDNPENLHSILQSFAQIDEIIVFPVHPRTRKAIESLDIWRRASGMSHLLLIPPVSYLDMLQLEQNARLVLTDSGGVQKEAYFFKVPCITLRETTEWVETIADGWNVLTGTDEEVILRAVKEFTPRDEQKNTFGDGNAAERIVGILTRELMDR